MLCYFTMRGAVLSLCLSLIHTAASTDTQEHVGHEFLVHAYGPGLHGGVVGYPSTFTIETNDETSHIDVTIEGPSEPEIERNSIFRPSEPGEHSIHAESSTSIGIKYKVREPGQYSINVRHNGEHIPDSPFSAHVVRHDAAKVVCYGPGLEAHGTVVGRPAEFTIDTRAAGVAPLVVVVLEPDQILVEVVMGDMGDGISHCHYTPLSPGEHKVKVTFGSNQVPLSPFPVFVSDATNPLTAG